MFIAREKRKQNIVEYFLYMFQVENSIRACNFNMDEVDRIVISQYKAPGDQLLIIRDWYKGLLDQMVSENIQEKGHLQSVINLINEVNDLHLWLLSHHKNPEYQKKHEQAKPFLLEFQYKVKSSFSTETEIALNAIYNYVLLKMQQKTISVETETAVKTISNFLNELSYLFYNYENGKMKIE